MNPFKSNPPTNTIQKSATMTPATNFTNEPSNNKRASENGFNKTKQQTVSYTERMRGLSQTFNYSKTNLLNVNFPFLTFIRI